MTQRQPRRPRRLTLVGVLLCALSACAVTPSGEGKPSSSPSAAGHSSRGGRPSGTPTLPAGGGTHSRPPNILLLLTDDQAIGDWRGMPKTRRLLDGMGTEFTQAISTYPLCCPARTTLLTGQYAHNHGVMGNEMPWGDGRLLDDSSTVPVWLHEHGYRTAIVGKYLHGYPPRGRATYVPPGWTDWIVPVDGVYHYIGQTINRNGHLEHSSRYQTSFVRATTKDLIRRYAHSRAPFFVWANFLAPHAGLPREPDDPRSLGAPPILDTPAVEAKYRDLFAGVRLPRTPSLNERNMSDKDRFLRRRPTLPLRFVDEVFEQRLESLRSVDDAVVDILSTLRRTGELRNTLVVLASDNGMSLGQHRWFHKVLGYEESIRVPLILAGPGVPRGERRSQLVSLTDLPATFMDVAGVTAPLTQDGTSLLPFAQDPAYGRGRALLLEAGGWPYPRVDRLYTGVRTDDGRVLLRWWDGHREVYDLHRDPYELDGRVNGYERPWVSRLGRALRSLRDCVGAVCSAAQIPPR